VSSEFIEPSEWVPVHSLPGFECAIEYHINRDGDIKSTKGGQERLLKPIKLKNGRIKYTLQQRLGQKGEKQVYAHTLVALAFLGIPPTPLGRTKGCTHVVHLDGNPANNCVDNLVYLIHVKSRKIKESLDEQ